MNAKYYKPIKLLRRLAIVRRRPIQLYKLFATGFWKSPSYYPEKARKSSLQILCELIGHIIRYGNIEWHYFTYGFDVKNFRDQSTYMDDGDFMWQTNTLNMVQADWDYTCMLRDKDLFSELLTMWGYNTPRTIMVLGSEGDISIFVSKYLHRGGYFVKPISGECGKGTLKVIFADGRCTINNEKCATESVKERLIREITGTPYVVQNIVDQLPEVNAIYPHALNTLRITTYYDKSAKRAYPFLAFYRCGANGGIADNWALGGILIGVDIQTGKLGKYGFFKHGVGTKTEKHPNTGFVFDNFQLPQYEECLQKALELHEHFRGIPIIGWDIALTKDGPMFIEGNDNVEMGPLQLSADRGLLKEYNEIKKKCLGY